MRRGRQRTVRQRFFSCSVFCPQLPIQLRGKAIILIILVLDEHACSVMDDFHQTLDELFYIGSAACSEIKQFQHDFVAILLHGGWPIYHATNALWRQTETSPFPVAFPLNIGREKEKRYGEHRQLFPFSRYRMFAGGYSAQADVGYFLNWVPEQSDRIDWVRTDAAG